MVVRAPVRPDTLRWARLSLGWDVSTLAKRINVAPERLEAWEAGGTPPTVNQLRNLAKALDRTMASFFVEPSAASGVPETVDFRGRGSEPLGHLAIRELRRVEEYRSRCLELADSLPPSFELARFSWDTLVERAEDLRRALGVTDALNGPRKLVDWIARVEELGVMVFQSTKIPVADYRGVSVSHEVAPLVLMNGTDSERGKIFTLFHEVAHLVNRTSAVCLERDTVTEEVLYNRFAGEFLMPERLLGPVTAGLDATGAITAVARRFGTSEHSAAIRLFHLGVATQADVDRAAREAHDAWEAELKRRRNKEKKGGPPPVVMRKRDLSARYLNVVIDAIEDRRIDLLDASYLLNTKVPTVLELRDVVMREAV